MLMMLLLMMLLLMLGPLNVHLLHLLHLLQELHLLHLLHLKLVDLLVRRWRGRHVRTLWVRVHRDTLRGLWDVIGGRGHALCQVGGACVGAIASALAFGVREHRVAVHRGADNGGHGRCLWEGSASGDGRGAESAGVVLHDVAETLERRVPAVLHSIVSASGEEGRNQRPLVADAGVSFQQNSVFFFRERVLLDGGIKVVVPALSALLAVAALEVGRNQGPALWLVLLHQGLESLIFFGGPQTLSEGRVQDLLPAVQALFRFAVLQERGDFFPVFAVLFRDDAGQNRVFFVGPPGLRGSVSAGRRRANASHCARGLGARGLRLSGSSRSGSIVVGRGGRDCGGGSCSVCGVCGRRLSGGCCGSSGSRSSVLHCGGDGGCSRDVFGACRHC